MTKTFLWIGILILAVYALIPGIMIRMFGYRAFKRGSRQDELALTFDDGPDEAYTGRLLDMLSKHQVKATFFVVGKNAETHPELIRRMHAEGHTIGMHNYVHHTNWLLLPQQVRRQIEQTSEVVRQITGIVPVYYRPPWGIINVFDFLTLRKFRLILWSRIVGDWRKSNDKVKLKRKLIKRLKGGEVIVLHDSGETFGAYRHAPEQMLQALDEYLHEVKGKGYSFVTIDEMFRDSQKAPGERSIRSRLFVFLFMQWEALFHLVFQVKKIDPANPFLHIRFRKYEGKTLVLQDGEVIRHGDRIAELHLDNRMLYQIGRASRSSVHLAIQLIRSVEQILPKIADHILNNREYDDIKGLYGITMINRGVTQLGFTVAELPQGVFASLTRVYLRFLLRVVHPQGKERLRTKSELLVPKIIAMSRKELLRRYHPENPAKLSVAEPEALAEHASHAAYGK